MTTSGRSSPNSEISQYMRAVHLEKKNARLSKILLLDKEQGKKKKRMKQPIFFRNHNSRLLFVRQRAITTRNRRKKKADCKGEKKTKTVFLLFLNLVVENIPLDKLKGTFSLSPRAL